MSSYTVIDIPGLSQLKIPKVGNPYSESNGQLPYSQPPEWMVQITDVNGNIFTSSTVIKYEKFSELLGFYGEGSRYTSPHITNSSLHTSAAVRHSELALIIPVTDSTVLLEQAMNVGTVIGMISIIHLGNVGDVKVTLQQIDYKTCYIQKHQQMINELLIRFTVGAKDNMIFMYDPHGNNKGKKIASYNFLTNQPK